MGIKATAVVKKETEVGPQEAGKRQSNRILASTQFLC